MADEAIALSVAGAKHRQAGKAGEDCCYAFVAPDQSYAMAIVADGHGASNYVRVRVGASLACESARQVLSYFAETRVFPANIFKGLEWIKAMLVDSFNRLVMQHACAHAPSAWEQRHGNPEDILEWYGTTLCALLRTARYTLAVAVGNWDLVVWRQGRLKHLLLPPATAAINICPGSMCRGDPEQIQAVYLPYPVQGE